MLLPPRGGQRRRARPGLWRSRSIPPGIPFPRTWSGSVFPTPWASNGPFACSAGRQGRGWKMAVHERRKFQEGFTLIEVLVSLTILAVGLLALALLHGTAVQGTAVSSKATMATELAQDRLGDIRRGDWTRGFS